jgi:hypothetical protein
MTDPHPSNGNGQRDRSAPNERREKSAFDRFEARPPDRSVCVQEILPPENEFASLIAAFREAATKKNGP